MVSAGDITRIGQLSPEEKRSLLERVVRERPTCHPVSFSQQRLWFLDRLTPGNPSYNVESVQRLGEDIDLVALEHAINGVVARHGALRTTFREIDGRPLQYVAPSLHVPLERVDLSRLTAAEREAALERVLVEAAREPMDLGTGPLLRTRLLELGAKERLLALRMHHIVADGWSMGVFAREMEELYAARLERREPVLPTLPIQYTDFAVWQREHLRGALLEDQLRYWREQLADAPNLDLTSDWTRPPVQSYRGAYHGIRLSKALTERARELGHRQGCTLFMVLLAAFAALLHRHTEQRDVVVATYVAGRTRAEIEHLIGFFLNTLVLRVSPGASASFGELLAEVKRTSLEAYAHQDLPFERLVEELRPPRDLSRNPIFQVTFQLNNAPTQGPVEGAEATLDFKRGASSFDLAFMLFETTDGLSGQFEYSTDLFDRSTIEAMGRQYRTLLAGALADPALELSRLPLLEPGEAERTVQAWNLTATDPLEPDGLMALFHEEARRREHEAVFLHGDERLDFGTLDRRSSQLGRLLARHGAAPERVVALCVERDLDAPLALYGIVKSGAAWLPLDATFPAERIAFILADARVTLVVTSEALRSRVEGLGLALDVVSIDGDADAIAAEDDAPLLIDTAPESLAYVIYTSGSTGRPKGVANTHRQILNRLYWMWDAYPFAADEMACQKTALSFVDSIWELFGGALCGVPTTILPIAVVADANALVASLARSGTTRLWLVPSLLRSILEAVPNLAARVPRLTFWVTSGEPLPATLHARFREAFPAATLYNLYGTSEVWDATWHAATETDLARDWVPIGKPIDNVRVHVVDAHLEPLPIGVPGELVVAGDGLPRGYIGAAAARQGDRFVTMPGSGERAYRTGDRVRWLGDGSLEHRGRLDHQIKLRGHRVEIAEIELALERHADIRRAAVTLRELGDGERLPVAWIVPEGDTLPNRPVLRTFLAGILPEWMIPAAFHTLEGLPHTPSGKLDRSALATLRETAPERESPEVAPRTATESRLATLWAELLSVSSVAIDDHFFADLGGHSLLAMQLIARLRTHFDVELPLRDVFEAPTVRQLARRLDAAGGGYPVPIAAGDDDAPPALVALAPDAEAPLSSGQRRMWFLERLAPGSPLLNVEATFPVDGTLHLAPMEGALADLMDRHRVLRMRVVERDGEPFQRVDPDLRVELPEVSLEGVAPAAQEARVKAELESLARRPFELERGPLLRAHVIHLSPTRHLLALVLHHIVTDAWSLATLHRELLVLYAARCAGVAAPLPPLPFQYADYADWQRRSLGGKRLERGLHWWCERLASAPALDLPTDRRRPALQTHRGAHHVFSLSPASKGALEALAREHDATLFMVCLAGFVTVLERWSGQEDLVVGTFVADRPTAELEPLVGMFLATLALRVRAREAASFGELVADVRDVTFEALSRQHVPFEQIVDRLAPVRDLGRNPLFQVALQLVVTAGTEDVSASLEARRGTTTLDLSLMLVDSPAGLFGQLEYSTDLFDASTAASFARWFERVLEAAAAAPRTPLRDLLLASDEELADATLEGPPTSAAAATTTDPGARLAERVGRAPDAEALRGVDGGTGVRELRRRALAGAAAVRSASGDEAGAVALHVLSTDALIVGALVAIATGRPFVTLDPYAPPERRRRLLAASGARLVLADRDDVEAFGDAVPVLSIDAFADAAAARDAETDADPFIVAAGSRSAADPACLLPVVGTDASLAVEIVPWWCAFERLRRASPSGEHGAGDVVAHLGVEDRVETIWTSLGAILDGATVAVLPEGSARDLVAAVAALARLEVSRLSLTPTTLSALLDGFPDLATRVPALRVCTLGGEPVHPSLPRRFAQLLPQVRLHTWYGSPVAGALLRGRASGAEDPRVRPVLGEPLDGVRLQVLDRDGRPVPRGMPGELHATCSAYGHDGRARPTGDRVRRRADGTLEHLERLDRVVWVRGRRVDPRELEAALRARPEIDDATVTVAADAPHDERLEAWVTVAEGEAMPDAHTLRDALAERLSEHLLPAHLFELATLPSAARERSDRAALAARRATERAAEHDVVAPRDETERALAAIWSDLLGTERFGVHDSFFELGGHSLMATRMIARVNAAFDVELSLQSAFEAPTIAALARALPA